MAGVPTGTSPSGPGEELTRSFVRSVAWTAAGKWLTQAITWPATIVIARLLSPSDYGLVAVVAVFARFVLLLTEAGLSAAVVTEKDVDRRKAAQLHTLAVSLGLVAFPIVCLLGPPLQRFYQHGPEFVWVVATLSLLLIIEALGVVPAAMLRRRFDYKALAYADWARAIVDIIIELVLAYLGFGYWALVIGMVAGALTWQIVVLVHENPGFARPERARVQSTLRLARYMLSRNFTAFLSSSSDVVIGGRLLSSAGVGVYNFAANLASVPVSKVTSLVVSVTPALFARVSNDLPRLRHYLLLTTEALSVVVFPAFAGLALVAPDLVPVLLGPKWVEATVPLQFLALNGAFFSVTTLYPQVLLVTGHAKAAARNGWFGVAVLPLCFFLFGRALGAPGLALAWLVAAPIIAAPLAVRTFRTLDLSAWSYLRSLWPAVSGTALMAALVAIFQHSVPGWPPAARLAVSTLAGALVYVTVTFALHRDRLREALALIRSVRE